MLFTTSYVTPNGGRYETQCYARDRHHLDEVMRLRNMGETSAPYSTGYNHPKMPSEHYADGDFALAMHATVWAAMIATRADAGKASGLLSDDGVVHEMAHVCENWHHRSFRSSSMSARDYVKNNGQTFLAKLQAWEKSIPGVHSSWGVRAEGEDSSKLDDVFDPYAFVASSGSVVDLVNKALFRKAVAQKAATLKEIAFEEGMVADFAAALITPLSSNIKSPKNRTKALAMASIAQGATAKQERIKKLLDGTVKATSGYLTVKAALDYIPSRNRERELEGVRVNPQVYDYAMKHLFGPAVDESFMLGREQTATMADRLQSQIDTMRAAILAEEKERDSVRRALSDMRSRVYSELMKRDILAFGYDVGV